MVKIIIYTKISCPYCTKAKALFNEKNIKYQEVDVTDDEQIFKEMIKKTNGRKTLPQIFINDKLIGGCDDLYQLYENDLLDL